MILTGIQPRSWLMARPLHEAPWQAAQRFATVLRRCYVPVIQLILDEPDVVTRLLRRLDPRKEVMEGFLQ